MIIEQYMIDFVRKCPFIPEFINYNDLQQENPSVSMMDEINTNKVLVEYVDGTTINQYIFSVLYKVIKDEEIEMNTKVIFRDMEKWFQENLPDLGENNKAIKIESKLNSSIYSIDEDGAPIYKGVFILLYFNFNKE